MPGLPRRILAVGEAGRSATGVGDHFLRIDGDHSSVVADDARDGDVDHQRPRLFDVRQAQAAPVGIRGRRRWELALGRDATSLEAPLQLREERQVTVEEHPVVRRKARVHLDAAVVLVHPVDQALVGRLSRLRIGLWRPDPRAGEELVPRGQRIDVRLHAVDIAALDTRVGIGATVAA